VTQVEQLRPRHELAPGVYAAPVFGDQMMLNLIEFEAGAVVALHSHPHEQVGMVLAGDLLFTIGGVEHRLGPDAGYQIPGGVEHEARAGPAGCRVLDVFHPVREDYRERWAR
jgi:quercetin dioxygenase-like cupin family protein